MYGWRGRIGLLVPSSNTTMEEEFRRLLPYGVSLHAARVRLRRVTIRELEAMKEELLDAAWRLVDANVNIIILGCTTGSLIKGIGYDKELSNIITNSTGIKAITTSTAVLAALKNLSLDAISVATPYIEEVNEREKRFLEDNGIKVLKIMGLNIIDNLEIGRLSPEDAYMLARKVDTPESKGVFISCTNFRTLEVIEILEKDLGKPVISSNLATFWLTLKEMGIKEEIRGYGKLLRENW